MSTGFEGDFKPCTENCWFCEKWKTVKEQNKYCPTRRFRGNAMRRAAYKARREKEKGGYKIND